MQSKARTRRGNTGDMSNTVGLLQGEKWGFISNLGVLAMQHIHFKEDTVHILISGTQPTIVGIESTRGKRSAR